MFRLESRDAAEDDAVERSDSVSPIANDPGLASPNTSPAKATSTDSRSLAKSFIARVKRTSLPLRMFFTVMSRSNLPEQTRTNAIAVAMARIHVGLNLEHEAREAFVGRLDRFARRRRRARAGGGPSFDEAHRGKARRRSW